MKSVSSEDTLKHVQAGLQAEFQSKEGSDVLLSLLEPQLSAFLESCISEGTPPAKAADRLESALSPIRMAFRNLTSSQCKRLVSASSSQEAQEVLFVALSSKWGQRLKSSTREQYRTKISRFLPDWDGQLTRFSGHRQRSQQKSTRSSGHRKSKINRDTYFKETNRQEQAHIREMKRGTKSFLRSSESRSRFEPYSDALFVNPTQHTPGVLGNLAAAVLLRSSSELPSPRKERALAALLCGIWLGWTKVLREARSDGHTGQRPQLVWSLQREIWIFPWLSNWWPNWMEADNIRRFAHFQTHHEVLKEYPLQLHPAAHNAFRNATAFAQDGRLFPDGSYSQAIKDLDKGLRSILPGAGPLTQGRLSLSFQGLANSAGYPWSPRYAITGSPARPHTIATTYTLTSLSEVINWHWSFVEQSIQSIQSAHAANLDRLGPIKWPPAMQPGQEPSPTLSGHVGSWSMPKIKYIQQVLKYLKAEANNSKLDHSRIHNHRTLLVMIMGAVTMGMRPFEVDGLVIPKRQPLEGIGFAQRVKRRSDETSSWVERRLPSFLQPLWWQVLHAGAELSKDGRARPVLLALDGSIRPFHLQSELDAVCKDVGVLGEMRAHGLRHFCRTELAHCGLSDTDLALLMNHWVKGFERTSYVRLGADLRGFDERFNRAVGKLLKKLGLEDHVWQ